MSEQYNPNAWYSFTDQNGETHSLKGTDPLIKESVTKGLPIYINERGEYFIYPYIEQNENGITANITK